MAFLDNRPLFPGHTLLVPREHHETLWDLPDELVTPLFTDAKRLSEAVRDAMGSQGAFVAMNNVVSQSVPHLHVHIAPAQPQGRPARLLLAARQVRVGRRGARRGRPNPQGAGSMTRPDEVSNVELVQWALGGIDLGVDADMSALFQSETVVARLRERSRTRRAGGVRDAGWRVHGRDGGPVPRGRRPASTPGRSGPTPGRPGASPEPNGSMPATGVSCCSATRAGAWRGPGSRWKPTWRRSTPSRATGSSACQHLPRPGPGERAAGLG